MTQTLHYDVAVIGYGPTGATAANLLGQSGLDVVVIERDPDVYGRARAISTDEEVLRIWQRVGLDRALQQDMLPGGVVAFVDADGRPFAEVTPASRGTGHPAQQFIYQPAVDGALREGVARFGNVTVLSQHECLKVIPRAHDVEVMAADLTDDEFVRLTASYVIAADGGSSSTRGTLGIGYSGTTYSERWIVIDTTVREDWPGSSRLRFHCDPDRPTVDCPTPLGHHRWEFPVLEGEDEKELVEPEQIWRVLARQGISERNVEILRAVVYSHHVRVADRWRVGRVFLAGDAAHAMPPWIGQGMSAGVRDAANLCWKIAGVLRGELDEAVLDSYQREREPHVRETTDHAVFAGRMITERRPWVAAARNVAGRLLGRIPGFTAWLVDAHWIPDAYYPDGFTVGGGDRKGAVGRQVPQPRVRTAGGEAIRLDDALGGGWAVVTTSAADIGPDWEAPAIPHYRLAQRPDGPRTLVDESGVLHSWLQAHGAGTVVLRPDGFVFAAAAPGEQLPPPPADVHIHSKEKA